MKYCYRCAGHFSSVYNYCPKCSKRGYEVPLGVKGVTFRKRIKLKEREEVPKRERKKDVSDVRKTGL